jgi:MoxR-like ATPase
MDRFLLKEILTYPAPADEIEILRRAESGALDHDRPIAAAVTIDDVLFLQEAAKRVYVDESIKAYIVALINGTRHASQVIGPELGRYVQIGASPRGAMALQTAGRALAILNGRPNVIPEDIKQLRHPVLRHRVMLNFEAVADKVVSETVIDAVFNATPTP